MIIENRPQIIQQPPTAFSAYFDGRRQEAGCKPMQI